MDSNLHCFGIYYQFKEGRLEVLVLPQSEQVWGRPGVYRLRNKFPGGGNEPEDIVTVPDVVLSKNLTAEKVLLRELGEEIGGPGFKVLSHEHLFSMSKLPGSVKRWDVFEYSGSLRTEEINDGTDRLLVPKLVDAEELDDSIELLPDHRLALHELILRLARKGYRIAEELGKRIRLIHESRSFTVPAAG